MRENPLKKNSRFYLGMVLNVVEGMLSGFNFLLLPKVKEEDMFNYVKESYNELVNKVTWPTFPQLQSSTIVVMVASVIFAVVVLAMDLSFENLMALIYKVLGGFGR